MDFKLFNCSFCSFLAVVSSIGIVFVIFKVSREILRRRRISNIPSVSGGLPFFGHVMDMIKGSPWDMMSKWTSLYGGIYKFHLFGSDAICISDPELLKVILQTKLSIFKKDLAWTYKPFLVLLGNGLVTADGSSWRKQRTLLSSHLRIEILELIPDMAFRAFQRFSAKLKDSVDRKSEVEMSEEFRHVTLQVIAEAVFSLPPTESDKTFAKMYLPIVEESNLRTWHPERMYLPIPAWFKFKRDVKTLNDFITKLIVERWSLRQHDEETFKTSGTTTSRKLDVLDKSLSAVTPEEWTPETINQIRDEMKTFILAGHETSASMLTWTLYELCLNETFLKTVRDEMQLVFKGRIDPTTGEVTSLPSRSELQEGLHFTECCLRESLRKYSIVPTVVRVASEDVDVGDYTLPLGTTVMINMQGVHHNPAHWPEPLTYNPARFFTPPQPFTFLPFIDGPRMCLGQYLSLLESKIILALLVHSFTFKLTHPEEAGLRHAFMVPIIPKTGHHMTIQKNQDF